LIKFCFQIQVAPPQVGETFDMVVATDCMYIAEAAADLVDTLVALCPPDRHPPTPPAAAAAAPPVAAPPWPVIFSYGRNRQGLTLVHSSAQLAPSV